MEDVPGLYSNRADRNNDGEDSLPRALGSNYLNYLNANLIERYKGPRIFLKFNLFPLKHTIYKPHDTGICYK